MRGASLARACVRTGLASLRTITGRCRKAFSRLGRVRAMFLIIPSLMLVVSGCAGTNSGAAKGDTPSTGSGGGTTFPWSSSGSKIGYVRSEVIAQRLPDYKDVENALRSDNTLWPAEAEKMEGELRVKESQLEELKLILSADRRKQLEDEVTTGRKELQRFRQATWYDENSSYLKRRKELMEPIDAKVNDAIYKVAEARGLDIVFDTVAGNVVYAKPGLDITDQVIEELAR